MSAPVKATDAAAALMAARLTSAPRPPPSRGPERAAIRQVPGVRMLNKPYGIAEATLLMADVLGLSAKADGTAGTGD